MSSGTLLALLALCFCSFSCLGRDSLSSRMHELEQSIQSLDLEEEEGDTNREWWKVLFGFSDAEYDPEYIGEDDPQIVKDKMQCAQDSVNAEVEYLSKLSECMGKKFEPSFVKKHTRRPKGSCGLMMDEVPDELTEDKICDKNVTLQKQIYDLTVASYAKALDEFNCGCMNASVKDLLINELGSEVVQEVAGSAAGVTAIALVSLVTGGLGTIPAIAVYMGGKYTVGILGGKRAVQLYHDAEIAMGATGEDTLEAALEEASSKASCEATLGGWAVDTKMGLISNGDLDEAVKEKIKPASSKCKGKEFEKCMEDKKSSN